MTTKTQRIEAQITRAVARARALGAQLVAQYDWGVTYTAKAGWTAIPGQDAEVCICGAIALAENPPDGRGLLQAIAKKYRMTVGQAASLSDGFEGRALYVDRRGYASGGIWYPKKYRQDITWYRIGKKWRAKADRIEPD